MYKLLTSCIIFTVLCVYSPRAQRPALIGKGVISTEDDEFGATFSPDGKTCFFTKKTPSTLQSSLIVICYTTLQNGHWAEPKIAPFSGRYKDFNPVFSPDGMRLYFISLRPVNGERKYGSDIWVVEKMGEGWSEPKNIGAPVNSEGYELGCSVTANGDMYFSSTGEDGNLDIYCSRFVNGAYQHPENLGDSINTLGNETEPAVAPDGSYIIFSSTGRADALMGNGAAYPRSDLYISFYKNGRWSAAKNLGPNVNSIAAEGTPFISADGKTLYFSSERNFISYPMQQKLEYNSLESALHSPVNGLGDIYALPVSQILSK